jgi:hypothetical protein
MMLAETIAQLAATVDDAERELDSALLRGARERSALGIAVDDARLDLGLAGEEPALMRASAHSSMNLDVRRSRVRSSCFARSSSRRARML